MSVVALRKLAMPAAEGVHAWAPFFYSYSAKEKSEMPNKTFFTYEQQIEKLTKEKQLVISDPRKDKKKPLYFLPKM